MRGARSNVLGLCGRSGGLLSSSRMSLRPFVAGRVIEVEPPLPGSEDHPFQDTLEKVPPELWTVIARRALAAEGDSGQAWSRLGLVSRTFRSAIAGDDLCDSVDMHRFTALAKPGMPCGVPATAVSKMASMARIVVRPLAANRCNRQHTSGCML